MHDRERTENQCGMKPERDQAETLQFTPARPSAAMPVAVGAAVRNLRAVVEVVRSHGTADDGCIGVAMTHLIECEMWLQRSLNQ